MTAVATRAAALAVFVSTLGAAAGARAQTPPATEESIDDPKVSRRLGTRITVPPPPTPPEAAAPTPAAPLARPPQPGPAPAPDSEAGYPPTIVSPGAPVLAEPFQPTLPRLKIGYRRFDFVRIGASPTPDGVAAPETFNSIGVDVYPVSNLLRIGLTSTFGWQSGTFLANGDYFATQTVSLGLQYRDLGRFVPFAEAFGGIGYMRRLQFERTIPTAFWQLGVDAGVEVYVGRVGYVSFALGYLRPVNGFAKRQQFTSVFVDTWSFKLGIGI
jgi:hypothetical protein